MRPIDKPEAKDLRCCGNCQYYIFEPWETGFYVCFNTGRSLLPHQNCIEWNHRPKNRDLTSAEICQIVGELFEEKDVDYLAEDLIFTRVRLNGGTTMTNKQIRSALLKKYAQLRGTPPIWFVWPDDKNKESE